MSIDDAVFDLSPQERNSPLWQRLSAHLKRELESRRRKNDDPHMTEQQTAIIRGHIECLKGLIDLGETPPQDG